MHNEREWCCDIWALEHGSQHAIRHGASAAGLSGSRAGICEAGSIMTDTRHKGPGHRFGGRKHHALSQEAAKLPGGPRHQRVRGRSLPLSATDEHRLEISEQRAQGLLPFGH